MIEAFDCFHTQAYIGGQWLDAMDRSTFDVLNPANDNVIAAVANCGSKETEQAISAAHGALALWSATPAKERARLMRAWFEIITANAETLATLLTIEQGKPFKEAKAEITYGASYIEWFGEEAKRIYGDVIPAPGADKRIFTIKQPVGVVGCITPWNFPNAMLARKIAPAIASGCTTVCKPANETPLSALALAHYANVVGIPDGVINILCGKTAEIGETLTGSNKVRKLTFTGSTAVGKKLTADCAATMKRTSMELGGNAPFIIFGDADIPAAVNGLMASKFRNSGQTCVCANRILVQANIYDDFAKALQIATEKLVVGDGMDPQTTIGPLIHSKAAHDTQTRLNQALEDGAKIYWPAAIQDYEGSNFVQPVILTDVKEQMSICAEEIFAPIAPLVRFSDEADAIRLANNTQAGLAAYVYTNDTGQMIRVAESLEYGMVGINEGIISNEMAPFGGVKESGNGREGSKYGLDDYLEIKYVCLGGL
ncbi:MAG: NAD-dependent succinate-semialdehyde dehydrogenase [Candidatus Azotimanducaceae bacterium]